MNTENPDIVNRIDDIYDEELWRAHEMSRSAPYSGMPGSDGQTIQPQECTKGYDERC